LIGKVNLVGYPWLTEVHAFLAILVTTRVIRFNANDARWALFQIILARLTARNGNEATTTAIGSIKVNRDIVNLGLFLPPIIHHATCVLLELHQTRRILRALIAQQGSLALFLHQRNAAAASQVAFQMPPIMQNV
jgi:hypothetical protein